MQRALIPLVALLATFAPACERFTRDPRITGGPPDRSEFAGVTGWFIEDGQIQPMCGDAPCPTWPERGPTPAPLQRIAQTYCFTYRVPRSNEPPLVEQERRSLANLMGAVVPGKSYECAPSAPMCEARRRDDLARSDVTWYRDVSNCGPIP